MAYSFLKDESIQSKLSQFDKCDMLLKGLIWRADITMVMFYNKHYSRQSLQTNRVRNTFIKRVRVGIMRNNHHAQQYAFGQMDFNSNRGFKENDQKWNFQNVNSVYEFVKEPLQRPHQQNYSQTQSYNLTFQKHNHSRQKYPTSNRSNYFHQPYLITPQHQAIPKNPSSKSNSQTNIISQNHSLQYLSSQEPSFQNKAQFTVCDDFNMDTVSPVKHHTPLDREQTFRKEWQNPNVSEQNIKIHDKFIKIYELVQQLKFMKEGLESKLKQQKINFLNEMQQVKKILFKLNIKYEKQLLEFSQKQTRPISRQPSMKQSSIRDDNSVQNELIELRSYSKRVELEKAKSEQRYQTTLKKYQQQIEMISLQLEKKLALERSSHLPGFASITKQSAKFPVKLPPAQQNKSLQSYQIEKWKTRLRQQQQNHSRAMFRLQQKVLSLQQEFLILQKSKSQAEKTIKQKQKQTVYRQSEIQYRLKDINRRQRELEMAEALIQKQREELQRQKDKIADFQLKVLKDQRKIKNQAKQKEIMTSEYFNNSQKQRILGKNGQDRSDSMSSKSSRIDINARLKEIQMMRNRQSRIYDENGTSRNCSKDSRTSGYKEYTTSRVSLTGRNPPDYGMAPSPSLSSKQLCRGSSQTIKLSEKLNRLTETLQKQLREMD